MDSDDDSLLAESEDSPSDLETDASSESSSHQMQNNKILILSSESLTSAEGTKYALPPELNLESFNVLNKLGLDVSAVNDEKGNPTIIKALPSSAGANQYILLPEPTSFSINEEQSSVRIQDVFYSSRKERRAAAKRIRDRNVTFTEKSTLFKICKKYPDIDDKTCNHESNNRKRKAWEGIHEEFIATCPDPESKDRSIKFLQGCWSRFKKESRRKARRAGEAHNKKEETANEAVSSPVPNESSAPHLSGTESQPALSSEPLNGEEIVSSGYTSDSLVNGKKGTDSNSGQPPTIYSNPCTVVNGTKTVTSNSVPLLPTSGSLLSGAKTDDPPLFVGDSDSVLRNGDPVASGEKTVTSKPSVLDMTVEPLLQVNQPTRLCLSSEFETKPMSIRSLRRKALELAVEVEKEKLAAFRYQKEAEQERLAAMKLQKSAQRYALMVEKEKYETELLKREAARLFLEKEKVS